MTIQQNLDVRGSLQLAMTPHLQQAINLLTMSHMELRDYIQDQMIENPLLQSDHEQPDSSDSLIYTTVRTQQSDDYHFLEHCAEKVTLKDHIQHQLAGLHLLPQERFIANVLIDSLNADGYLGVSIAEIAATLKINEQHIDHILKKLQHLEPVGIFATNLMHCLKLQIKDRGLWSPLWEKFIQLLPDFPKLGALKMAKKLGMDHQTVKDYLAIIRTLNPKPGAQFDTSVSQTVIPDVIVFKENGQWHVKLNPQALPACFLNTAYYQELQSKCKKGEEIHYLKDKKAHAHWLVSAVEQRALNLLKVAKAIVDVQSDFLDYGISKIKPLTLKEIAQKAEVHESTVSRITTQKYMQTPFGNVDLKFFFSSKLSTSKRMETDGLSSKCVMDKIQKMITIEDAFDPLSDEDISALLKSQGIQVARRTVAKYRTILKIGSRFERMNKA